MSPLILLVVVCGSDQSDQVAARLLQQAQGRLLQAKVLEIRYEGVWETAGKTENRKLNGSFSLSLPQRTLSAQCNVEERNPYKKSMTGDGVPQKAREALEAISRAGVLVPFFWLETYQDEFKDKGWLLIDPRQLDRSAPKLGGKEKIGGRQTQQIEFTSKSKDGKLVTHNQVWIDTQQQVPVQWKVTATRGRLKITATETYRKIELGD
jgi:hypothetical protein